MRRHTLDERADGHESVRRRDSQFIELCEAAAIRRVAYADIDFLVAVVRPVLADEYAIGNQLYHRADESDVGAEAGGLGAVHLDLPFDTGQRPTILDIGHGRMLFEHGPDLRNRAFDKRIVACAELDVDRLALGRAGVRRTCLDRDTGEIGGAITNLGQYFVRLAALVPVDKVQRQ